MTLENEWFWAQFLDAMGMPVTEGNLRHIANPSNWKPKELTIVVSISKIPYQPPRHD